MKKNMYKILYYFIKLIVKYYKYYILIFYLKLIFKKKINK